jgi:hypothetical protein
MVIITMEKSKYERAMELSEKHFRLLTGVRKQTFAEMSLELQKAYDEKHKNRGRHSKLSIETMLMMALSYWRQYITFFELAFEYGVSQSVAHGIVVWVEDTLIKCGKFNLLCKKALLEDKALEIVLLDVMESPVERPKKTKAVLLRKKEKAPNKDTDFRQQRDS